jgi:hypothetical protein
MKWLLAVLFSFLTLGGILKDLAVLINFQTNQEYIVMTMCSGRSEPVNTCNGSCYLTKQLKLAHNHGQESDSQVPPNFKKNITYFFEEITERLRPLNTTIGLSSNIYFATKATRGHPSAVFQPPKYC